MGKTATIESTSDLTDKQRVFCEEYVIDWNSTRAAIKAGYSEKTAYSIGSENLRKPEIQAYISEIQKDLAKLAGVSALRNMKELAKIAYSSAGAMRSNWEEVRNWDDLSDDDKSILSEIEVTKRSFGSEESPIFETKVKYKVCDKQRAIEILNKMNKWTEPEIAGGELMVHVNWTNPFDPTKPKPKT